MIDEFRYNGSIIDCYDPFISEYKYKGKSFKGLKAFSAHGLSDYDFICITTAHTAVDYDLVAAAGVPVLDCKNVCKGIRSETVEVL